MVRPLVIFGLIRRISGSCVACTHGRPSFATPATAPPTTTTTTAAAGVALAIRGGAFTTHEAALDAAPADPEGDRARRAEARVAYLRTRPPGVPHD